mgnify:CR=1 FL=1
MLNHNKLKNIGIDFFRGTTEWQPQILSSFGGIVADAYGRTKVKGLYAVCFGFHSHCHRCVMGVCIAFQDRRVTFHERFSFGKVKGLYAVGRSRFLDAGVYIGGFDLSTTATTGYLAAEGIHQYLQQEGSAISAQLSKEVGN